ncbi:hypothetical protein ACIQCD_05115 [Streptomyces sp. NPDC093250]|uniref:hypothetical protein n=1 Tax=unclassified Streptomyces TaxID=2593676 RepID=UPI003412C94A
MASRNDHGTPDPQVEARPAAAGGPVLLVDHNVRQQRDKGALDALAAPAGRPKVDPRDREIAKLKAEKARLEADLAKARTVIEVQGKLYVGVAAERTRADMCCWSSFRRA